MKNIKANAVVSAHTGILMGDFRDMHEYIEHIMGRPVWTHELGLDKDLLNEIKARSEEDFFRAVGAIEEKANLDKDFSDIMKAIKNKDYSREEIMSVVEAIKNIEI